MVHRALLAVPEGEVRGVPQHVGHVLLRQRHGLLGGVPAAAITMPCHHSPSHSSLVTRPKINKHRQRLYQTLRIVINWADAPYSRWRTAPWRGTRAGGGTVPARGCAWASWGFQKDEVARVASGTLTLGRVSILSRPLHG
eukprot:1167299-Prorocentrum_minimum.AAC.1